jgi:DNA-binding response OmpR family regulator
MTKNNSTTNRDNNNRILLVDDELHITTASTMDFEDSDFKVDVFQRSCESSVGFQRGLVCAD